MGVLLGTLLGPCPATAGAFDGPAAPEANLRASSRAEEEREGPTSFSASVAGAWAPASIFGGVRDRPRRMLAVDLRLHKRIVARDTLALDYTVGLVPVELEGGTVVEDPVLGERKRTVYGAGLDPVGLFARFGRGGLCPFASFRGGIRIFETHVPNPRGTRFNFTAGFAAGLAQRVGSRAGVAVGVEFHHVSNGGLGSADPSLNLFALRLSVLVTGRSARRAPSP
jgi:hypothetical protein